MNNTSTCANCGKGEETGIDLKACAACKLVKYCSRDCQIAHRSQHKKECKKRAKELHEIELYKQPPPLEDCPICMIRLPTLESGRTYMACCGKSICTGCVFAFQSRALLAGKPAKDRDLCPFCRVQAPSSNEELIKRYKRRLESDDPIAIHSLGSFHDRGQFGLPQNHAKALELWHRAAELGNADSYTNIANAYMSVERKEKKALHYYKLAAMRGNELSRHNLGISEIRAGNIDKALQHWMIAVKGGHPDSLASIKRMYLNEEVTKDDYDNAVQSYQAYLDEIQTDQRDEAAAFDDRKKYYDSSF